MSLRKHEEEVKAHFLSAEALRAIGSQANSFITFSPPLLNASMRHPFVARRQALTDRWGTLMYHRCTR